jgi:hypothetical protein
MDELSNKRKLPNTNREKEPGHPDRLWKGADATKWDSNRIHER